VTTTVWDRLGLWRLTRSRTGRQCYELLTSAGVTVARLDRFVHTTPIERESERVPLDSSYDLTHEYARDGVPAGLEGEPLAPEDLLLLVRRDDRTVGYCLLSDRPVYVPELDRRLAFPEAYLWRVYVDPAHRGQGIGTSLIGRAVDAASETFEAASLSALVAPDNVPSRRAFASAGFEQCEQYATVGVGDHQWTRGDPPRGCC